MTVIEVELQVDGTSVLLPNCTTEPDGADAQTKLLPVTVNGNDALPTAAGSAK